MSDEKEKPDHFKVYGRGFADGVRAARLNTQRNHMNASRLRELEKGLNGFSRHVYEAVPIQRSVSQQQVIQTLADKGKSHGIRAVEACLRDLTERGLCKGHHGQYQRHEIILHPVTKAIAEPKPVPADVMAHEGETPIPATPFDEIAGIEKELESVTELIGTITGKLSGIRNSLSAAAVNIDDYVKNIRKDYAKLDALKKLLKDL